MKKLLSIFFLILFPAVVFSQTEKQLLPSDLKQQTIVTEPATLNKGFFRVGITGSYGVTDKYFNDKGKRDYFLNSAWGSSLGSNLTLQYGLTNRLQVELTASYMNTLHESQSFVIVPYADTTAEYSFTLRGKGVGDSYASVKYQIFPEGDNKSSLTGRVDITLPTGRKNPSNIKSALKYDLPTGNGHFVAGLNLTYRKITYPFSYTGYFEYNYKLKGTKLINASDSEEKEFKDGDYIRTGGSLNFHMNEWIALTNDLSFYYKGHDKVENIVLEGSLSAWVIAYETHIVFQIKQFRLAEAIVIPLKGKNNISADPQYIIIAQFLF